MTYFPRHIEPQAHQAILERFFRNLMDLVEGIRGRGAAERDAGSLGGEDGIVEVFLRGVEDGFDGPGAGDVGDVVAVFLFRCWLSLGLVCSVQTGKERGG